MDLGGKAIISENYVKPKQHIKKQRHSFAHKGLYSQSYGFSSGHVWMWELNHKEGWAPKNWCFRTMVLEKTLESPLDYKEINPKGNQSWIFLGRTDVEAETSIIWPPEAWSQFIRKDPDVGKDWRQEEKGTTEDKMVGLSLTQQTCLRKIQDMVKDTDAWCVAVHSVAKSKTWLSYWITNYETSTSYLTFTVTFNIHFNSITLL